MLTLLYDGHCRSIPRKEMKDTNKEICRCVDKWGQLLNVKLSAYLLY